MEMNLHLPLTRNRRKRSSTGQRGFRLAVLGDGLIGPMLRAGRGPAGLERQFAAQCWPTWFNRIAPGLDIAQDRIIAVPNATTVLLAKHVPDILDLDPRPDAVLISAGMEDCLQSIKGIAPAMEEATDALEAIAAEMIAAGIEPIFVLPPPCALFSNGLFADRFVAITATLRHIAERRRLRLVDATPALLKRRAHGLEPDERYVSAAADGTLSELGAFRMASEAAHVLDAVPMAEPEALDGDEALNGNPSLSGKRGVMLTKAVSGNCATGYSLDAYQTGGATIAAAVRASGQRLMLSGRYSSQWGFVRLSQHVGGQVVDSLGRGDEIEASCDISLSGLVENIAAVSLHATAVWDNDFVGLHSSQYVGGPGVSEPYAGRLRTPSFKLPGKLKKLHVSLQVHLRPGADLDAHGSLDIHAMAVRRISRAHVATSPGIQPSADIPA
jgi:hypothetical protein